MGLRNFFQRSKDINIKMDYLLSVFKSSMKALSEDIKIPHLLNRSIVSVILTIISSERVVLFYLRPLDSFISILYDIKYKPLFA